MNLVFCNLWTLVLHMLPLAHSLMLTRVKGQHYCNSYCMVVWCTRVCTYVCTYIHTCVRTSYGCSVYGIVVYVSLLRLMLEYNLVHWSGALSAHHTPITGCTPADFYCHSHPSQVLPSLTSQPSPTITLDPYRHSHLRPLPSLTP